MSTITSSNSAEVIVANTNDAPKKVGVLASINGGVAKTSDNISAHLKNAHLPESFNGAKHGIAGVFGGFRNIFGGVGHLVSGEGGRLNAFQEVAQGIFSVVAGSVHFAASLVAFAAGIVASTVGAGSHKALNVANTWQNRIETNRAANIEKAKGAAVVTRA